VVAVKYQWNLGSMGGARKHNNIDGLEDVSKLKVVELKERLLKIGASTKGKKAELVERLQQAMKDAAGVTKGDVACDESLLEDNKIKGQPDERVQTSAEALKEQARQGPPHLDPGEKKLTASQRMNLKKKIRKKAKQARKERNLSAQTIKSTTNSKKRIKAKSATEYSLAPLDFSSVGVQMSSDEFSRIIARFNGENDGDEGHVEVHTESKSDIGEPNKQDDEKSDSLQLTASNLSKKRAKKQNRMKIGELKQRCSLPELVEAWDVTAADPVLLVHLKASRNTVPVPRHWSQKRKYLQGKKGIEKPPFKLPAFIAATGIGEMRQAYEDKAEAETMRALGKARTRPKMGKMDIDYRVLYDAFFRHQQKPQLTKMGDLYYEGKEFEVGGARSHHKPGVLSDTLLEALGIQRGAPPPWLIAMQRYGPPPSYPSLQIPGLNAPIPPGAHFGYHPGGWGKPPVDEYGNPIYGDVFGENIGHDDIDDYANNRVYWGELEEDVDEESSTDESEVEASDSDNETENGDHGSVEVEEAQQKEGRDADVQPTSEEQLQLRKEGASKPQLYQVLEQKKSSSREGGIMGSEHVYTVPSALAAKRLEALKKTMPDIMDVSIDPSDLETLDDNALKELYEAKLAETRAGRDFSDMVAHHQASNAAEKKRKASTTKSSKDKKFKF
jgi:splicing factor 3B subunit 2